MALPQLAHPDDIAHAAVFLSSDLLARHITGQTVVIPGGMEGRWLWQRTKLTLGFFKIESSEARNRPPLSLISPGRPL